MSDERQLKLVASRGGRMVLHLAGLSRDGHWANHMRGIWREVMRTTVKRVVAVA